MFNFIKKRVNFFLFIYLKKNESNKFEKKIKKILGENSSMEIPKIISGENYISIGKGCSIGHSAWLAAYDSYLDQKFTPKIIIQDNVRIGNYACITSIDEVKIESGCLFSEYVYISDHYHGVDPNTNLSPKDQPLFSKGRVCIGRNTFIGYRVTILSGVNLGSNCVVGAHSVVTKSFPDYSMVAGTPAKLIKTFNFDKNDWIYV